MFNKELLFTVSLKFLWCVHLGAIFPHHLFSAYAEEKKKIIQAPF